MIGFGLEGTDMRVFLELLVLSLALVLPGVAAAKDKGVRAPGPDIGKILGDAYEVPPELSSRAKPGTVIVWDKVRARLEAFRSGCVSKTPTSYEMTNVTMKSNLAGGVRMNVGPIGGGVEA